MAAGDRVPCLLVGGDYCVWIAAAGIRFVLWVLQDCGRQQVYLRVQDVSLKR